MPLRSTTIRLGSLLRSVSRGALAIAAPFAAAAAPGPAPYDRFVTNDAELASAIAAAPGTSWIIELADSGTFSARALCTNKTNITLRPQTRRGPLLPAGLGVVVAGDLNAYDFHFTGPTFDSPTLENIVDRFTPKPASYFTAEGIGAIGTGYNWSTRAMPAIPTFTKPKTSNAAGIDPALTTFDGTNDWLQLTGTAPLLGMTNRRALTIIFNATYDGADNLDRYYAESAGTDFTVRKLPTSGRMRYRYKNNANAAIGEIDSSALMTQKLADGADPATRTWTFSVNQTTGRYFIMRGKELDPFPSVTQLKSDDINNTRAQMAVMAQNDTSPPAGTGVIQGRFGLFYMTDQFIDLGVAANHNPIVATDGRPADWGANGSAVTGTQPRAFIKGNAAALFNGGSGINLGSSSQKFVLTGAIEDAA